MYAFTLNENRDTQVHGPSTIRTNYKRYPVNNIY